MSAFGLIFSIYLMLLFSTSEVTLVHGADVAKNVSTGKMEMVPLIEEGKVRMVNESRRKLGSFQICSLCTCCGGANGYCMPTPCCYAINCNLPNKPFGFCSFTPKTCNCFGCHVQQYQTYYSFSHSKYEMIRILLIIHRKVYKLLCGNVFQQTKRCHIRACQISGHDCRYIYKQYQLYLFYQITIFFHRLFGYTLPFVKCSGHFLQI